jgi:large subunit ribosomal protein L4
MQVSIYNQKAEVLGDIQLSDKIFGLPMNQDLLYQVVNSQLANKRQIIAHTKDRGEVRGGGRKPWKQKGTGRARHGSSRSPIWKGGGITFGPRNEKIYAKKINRKMAKKALGVALSAKIRDGALIILDNINLTTPKTKEASVIFRNILPAFPSFVSTIKRKPSVLLVIPSNEGSDMIIRSISNLPNVEVIEARNLNSLDVLSRKHMLFLKDSVEVIEKQFAKK